MRSFFLRPRFIFFLLVLCWIPWSTADDRNPLAGDAKAAKAGEYEFRINCALCHGLGAPGGGRGPDLTRAQKKYVHTDAEMFQVIGNGIPGTAMPSNGTNGQGVGMTDEKAQPSSRLYPQRRGESADQPIGNVAHGKELFYGDAGVRSVTWSRAKADGWARS